jgi:hypothetical protein
MAVFRYALKMDRTPADISAQNGLTICLVGFPGGTPDSLRLDVARLPAGEAAARILGHCRQSSR